MVYDPNQSTDKDRARARLEDTNPAAELFTDLDYQVELARHVDWRLGAAVLARRLSVREQNAVTSFTATGDFSSAWINRPQHWLTIAEGLEAEVAAELAAATAGSGLQVITMPFLDGDEYEGMIL